MFLFQLTDIKYPSEFPYELKLFPLMSSVQLKAIFYVHCALPQISVAGHKFVLHQVTGIRHGHTFTSAGQQFIMADSYLIDSY